MKIDEAAFQTDLPFIRAMIRYEIDAVAVRRGDARRHLIAVDPQAQFALALFGEAERLTETARAKGTRAGGR